MDQTLEHAVLEALRAVEDPEVGINVVDLGLVYGIEVSGREVSIRLTLTSVACPLGEQVAEDVEAAVRAACPDLDPVNVVLVWEPPWSPERMSPAARERLGWPADGASGG